MPGCSQPGQAGRRTELVDSIPALENLVCSVRPLQDPHGWDRRLFLKAASFSCMAACAAACLKDFALAIPPGADDESRYRKEAKFYQKLSSKQVQCRLCPRQCTVANGRRGYCGVRENRDGTYYTLVHSRVCTAHVDPIEKKPLFHFLPGASAFSIATGGCNVNCKFCQNWEISQARPEQLRATYLPPKLLAEAALQNHCQMLAYTYSEPTVFCEYILDAAADGRAAGLKSVVVSNGFIQQEPLKELCRHVDAIKVDLKAFSPKYYREIVNGELQPVLDSLTTIRKQGTWTEIVYLVVPTLNDSDGEFRNLARWVKAELGPDVPIHFTRFFPLYRLRNLPPTPLESLQRAKTIADAEGLQYVYIGNVPGHPAENTYCPKCRKLVVERTGFTITQMHIRKSKCSYCQHVIAGRWHS